MAQQAVPARDARLGRAAGIAGDGTVHGVVLLLPGGEPASMRRHRPHTATATRRLARWLTRIGGPEGIATHVVHYRYRGWNGDAAHPAQDAEWAADEALRRYGDVPVCLAGARMGGRAALRAAGHPAVTSVLALAPWLPDAQDDAAAEPVRQLIGRRVLLAHGTVDRRTEPHLSYRLAERAKKINPDVCRFEVHTDDHRLRQHRNEIRALAADFVLGSLLGRGYCRPVTDAMAAPPPLGLRMPLAAGFGASLRP